MPDTPVIHEWQFRAHDAAPWRTVTVPAQWESYGVPATAAGPCAYRATILPPALPPGARYELIFGAVSYHCVVAIDGAVVGEHTGLWDAFAFDVTSYLTPGVPAALHVIVEKPAGLTAGPDSAQLAGRFPLRETLSGFIPYVQGHMFGGIWQPVLLRVVAGGAAGGAAGVVAGGAAGVVAHHDAPLRYPRMALAWGWYADAPPCDPGPARVRADMHKLRDLGFNGVKLCLWLPPPYYFAIADELGMLLWLELPLWLPRPNPTLVRQIFAEYAAIVRAVRQHPSVIMITLGCELNRATGPEILGPLYTLVKDLSGGLPVRDNSGSGAAYGGLLDEFADFDDYHFYCDPQHLAPLIAHFTPPGRPPRPWFFGEFCDLDTFRDPRTLGDAWWASADPQRNPQGARWQYDLPFHTARLHDNRLAADAAELTRTSYLAALLHRKTTIEIVRSHPHISGYVITGEADTPISTAGMWDDAGALKFDPASFRQFNADTVALIAWERRRDWLAGGDRVAERDPHCRVAGTSMRAQLLVSHFAGESAIAATEWWVAFEHEAPFVRGSGSTADLVNPGTLIETCVVSVALPQVAAPRRATMSCTTVIGTTRASNRWPLWIFPATAMQPPAHTLRYDPAGLLAASGLAPATPADVSPDQILVASRWDAALAAWVGGGGRAILFQQGDDGPLPARALPFRRECVVLVRPHTLWADFPHDGWADLQFGSMASDHALDLVGTSATPLLERIDTRTLARHSYAALLTHGNGRVLTTTLRHSTSPAMTWLLRCWAAGIRGL